LRWRSAIETTSTLELSWLGGVFGQRVVPLGVEKFGQTGNLADLYAAYRLDGDAITDLANAAEAWGMRALRAVNSKVLEGGDIQGSALGKWRMNFGLYFYAEPMDAPQPEELQRDGT